VRWRSEWIRLRLPFKPFSSYLPTQQAAGLVTLEAIPSWELDAEVGPLVLEEIQERVYAQVRHHWIQRLVGVLWLVLGVPAAALLFLLGTPDTIVVAVFLAGLAAVWTVRRRGRTVVLVTLVLAVGAFVVLAGPYREHIHIVPLLALVGCAARCIWLLVAFRRDLFVVTEHRVIRLWGVLFKNRAVVPLGRILDITVHKPLLGRLCGYGHLVFESAAQEQGLRDVRFMPEPDTVDRIIQILQYGGPPNPTAAGETPAEAESEIPDTGADMGQPYIWGG